MLPRRSERSDASGARPLRAALLLVASLACTASLFGAETIEHPLLWRVEAEGGAKPSWLFGTIHLSDPRVMALGPEVEAALEEADAIFTELPFDRLDVPTLVAGMALPDRKKLSDVLPPPLLERLEAVLRARNLSPSAFERFQPWAMALVLETLDFQGAFGGAVLDQYVYDEALGFGKEAGGLETMEEQVAALGGYTLEEQIELLEATIESIERKGDGDEAEELIANYVAGDGEALLGMFDSSDSGEAGEAGEAGDAARRAVKDKYRVALLDERNERMAERVAAKVAAAPERSFFVAVGAAHMFGEKGLVELLRDRGLRVTRVKPPPTKAQLRERIRELEGELRETRVRLERAERGLRRSATGSRREV